MRIFWDSTKITGKTHYSGLTRVSRELRKILGATEEVIPILWDKRAQRFKIRENAEIVRLQPEDFFITPELFCELERKGISQWIDDNPGKSVAIFHDAIPLKHPEFTWPKSVARHPHYMKHLAAYDLVLANSRFSNTELRAYWDWLGLDNTPDIVTIPLGADFSSEPRKQASVEKSPDEPLKLLMVGILEPRKNQETVLDAVEILHKEGIHLELSIVGRVNPHFGKPIAKRIEQMKKNGLPIIYGKQLTDGELKSLYDIIDVTVFPSRAEGNGLPVIESIWMGKPAIVSPIDPHIEHCKGGEGIVVIDPFTTEAFVEQIRKIATNPEKLVKLKNSVANHLVPTWKESADAILMELKNR